jgi:hypothetical protein
VSFAGVRLGLVEVTAGIFLPPAISPTVIVFHPVGVLTAELFIQAAVPVDILCHVIFHASLLLCHE